MDEMYGRLMAANESNKAGQERAEERHHEASNGRLLKILKKKISTSFIGALARFEAHFGEVWGHGLDQSECTPGQLAWRKVWEEARTEVLNNGNAQSRAVESEMGQYTVAWDGYRTVLPVG